jgi:hypothetical protein
VNFAPWNLMLGIFPPFEEVLATGIRIYTPARHSPSGLNEPVIEINQAHVYERKGRVVIDNLLATSQGVRVIFSGSGPLQLPRMEADSGDEINRIPLLLGNILRLPENVDADCRIQWTGADNGTHTFDVFALSETFAVPGLTLQKLVADARLHSDGTSVALTQLALEARLASIEAGKSTEVLAALPLDLPAPVSIVAKGPPLEVPWGTIPSQIGILLRQPFNERIPVDLLHLETSFKASVPDYRWIASGNGFFAEGLARPFKNGITGEAPPKFPLSIDFRAYLDNPFLSTFFPNLPDHRLIRDAHARFIRLSAKSTPDDRLTGSFVSDHLYIGETRFAHIHSGINLSRSDILLDSVHVQKTANQSATGSYSQHFPSSRFALNARGAILPQSLDNLLGRWWRQIFTHIQASGPLSGDVTVWGFWRDEKSLRSVTAVEGSGASYRDIAVPKLRVRVRSNGGWAFMNELEAYFGEQRITGQIAWQQGLPDDVRRPILIRFESDAPWPIVQQASGVEALQELDLGGLPEVFIDGTLWQRSRDADPETPMIPDLRLSLRNPGAHFRVSGLDLQSMRFEGRLLRNSLALRSVSGQLADGVFTGRIGFRNWADPERQERHLQIQLFDAFYTEALKQISGLLDNPEVVREPLLKDEEGGRLDADIDLLIKPELTESRGQGRITLRNGRVGEIHVFGGLSRALSTMGLGFSTLDLNAASLEWTLQDGMIGIPQCLVTGPVLNMRLAGNLDVKNDRLAMRAEAYFFGGLVSKVLTPVSDNFQFDVTGTLANPNWQLRLNPFRWFQNRLGAPSTLETSLPAGP